LKGIVVKAGSDRRAGDRTLGNICRTGLETLKHLQESLKNPTLKIYIYICRYNVPGTYY